MANLKKYDPNALRAKLKQQLSNKDPHEFRPAKAQEGKTIKYRCYILPGLEKGETCVGGVAAESTMNDMFFVNRGLHWYNNKPTTCPRVTHNEECKLCQAGFDLIQEIKSQNQPKEKEKELVSRVARQFISNQDYLVNIYVTDDEINPVEYRNKVMWTGLSKTIFDKCCEVMARDDSGDPKDPQAYGIFFDPFDGYILQYVVRKNGQNNDYKESKFLPERAPIAVTASGEPDEAEMNRILDSRHDLSLKIDPVDYDKLNAICNTLLSGDDGDSNDGAPSGGGVKVHTESAPPVTEKKQAKAPQTSTTPTQPPVKQQSKVTNEVPSTAEYDDTSMDDSDDEDIQNILNNLED